MDQGPALHRRTRPELQGWLLPHRNPSCWEKVGQGMPVLPIAPAGGSGEEGAHVAEVLLLIETTDLVIALHSFWWWDPLFI